MRSSGPWSRWAEGLHLGTPLALVTLLVLAYASGMSLVAVRELSRLEARVRSLAEAVALLDARTYQVQDQRPAAAHAQAPPLPRTEPPGPPPSPAPTQAPSPSGD